MPFKCSVPNCKGNYKNGPQVSTFSFPKDEVLRNKWIHAIKREDLKPTNNSKVCELHFSKNDIENLTTCYVEATGERLTAPLQRPRLRKGAIPSLLPDCPQYLSKPEAPHRESPEEKQNRLEYAMLNKAIEDSLVEQQSYHEKIGFSSIEELSSKLNGLALSKWIVSIKQKRLYIIYLEENPCPIVKCCVCVSEDLTVSVFRGNTEIKALSGMKLPAPIENLNEMENILEAAAKSLGSIPNRSLEEDIHLVSDILSSLAVKLPQQEEHIEFLREQVNLEFKQI